MYISVIKGDGVPCEVLADGDLLRGGIFKLILDAVGFFLD